VIHNQTQSLDIVQGFNTQPVSQNPYKIPVPYFTHHNYDLPVWIDDVQEVLKLWISLSLLHHGQVVAESTQTRLELLVLQPTALVLVEMLKHGEALLSLSALIKLKGHTGVSCVSRQDFNNMLLLAKPGLVMM
jgi:hypothetical protein